MILRQLTIFFILVLCITTLSTKLKGQSASARIADVMKKFQNNIGGMEGLKNDFFSADAKDVINVKSENAVPINEYVKSNFFKRLNFQYSGFFESCKNDYGKFYYVYTYEAKSKKYITFELNSEYKIRTFVTEKHESKLSFCKYNGGDNIPRTTPNQLAPQPNYLPPPTASGSQPDQQSKSKSDNRTTPCPPCQASDAVVKENESVKRQNLELEKDNKNQAISIEELNRRIKSTSDSLAISINKFNKLNSTYSDLYNCINFFCDSVTNKLNAANDEYDFYLRQRNVRLEKKKEAQESFKKAWAIYKEIYTSNVKNPICLLTKKDCLGKNPKACLNMANALIFNNENIVDELGTNLNDKLNTRTEMILFCLSLIIKDNGNEFRSQAIELLAYLPRILFQEKTNTNSGSVAMLSEIKTDFEKGSYSSSLGKFDRIYYLLELKEFKAMKKAVQDAKYSVGMILLWELVDVETIKPWVIPGSWMQGFEKNTNQANSNGNLNKGIVLEKNSARLGRNLLIEVEKELDKNDKEMIKKIKYARSKFTD